MARLEEQLTTRKQPHYRNGATGGTADADDEESEGEPPSGYIPTSSAPIHTGHIATSLAGPRRRRPRLNRAFALAAVAILANLFQSCGRCDARGLPGVREMLPSDSRFPPTGVRGALRSDAFTSQRDIYVGGDAVTGAAGDHDNCTYECCVSNDHVRHLQSGSSNALDPCQADKAESSTLAMPMAVQYILIVILLLLSALFSGLTLGLMSLDPSGLEIVMSNKDDPALARAAAAINPVRLNGNLLLCTLLLGNVGVNSLLSILLADLTSGMTGFLVSTFAIVIFGEIIPQALCSRYSLQIGEKTVPLVKIFMVLLYPLCKPMSMVLNKALGHEIGTTYSASEMAKLIEMHVQRGQFEADTGTAMTGALRYRNVAVSEVFTPLVNTFMLGADERLGFDTVAKIFRTGYSRIPVYEVSKSNIIGLLFVKDLIFLDPEDEIPVKNFVQIFGRGLHVVWPDDKLGDVMKLLKKGRSHMALVRDVNDGEGKMDPFYEIKGIITLEDIVEVILGDEIVDETDLLVEVNDPESKVERSDLGVYIDGSLETNSNGIMIGGTDNTGAIRAPDWESRLRLLDERLVDDHLSAEEVRAVAAHLKTNYANAMELISDKQLRDLLAALPVTNLCPAGSCATDDTGDEDCGVPTNHDELLYERGVAADFCTVVLSGKIVVLSGADKFRSDVSNWGVLASRSLTDSSYVPDFSAWVVAAPNSGGCRCVQLGRAAYNAAIDNTAIEKSDLKPHFFASVSANPPVGRQNVHTLMTISKPTSKDEAAEVSTESRRQQALKEDTQVDHIVPVSYVQTTVQEETHSRRSKLLRAFMRASKKNNKSLVSSRTENQD